MKNCHGGEKKRYFIRKAVVNQSVKVTILLTQNSTIVFYFNIRSYGWGTL